MIQVERQVQRVQRRLWLGHWLEIGTRLLAWAAAAFAVLVLVQRAYRMDWPVSFVAGGLVSLAVLVALIIALRRRPDAVRAAAVLDEAADLRERTSTSVLCTAQDDPFVAAVQADAEQRVMAVRVRQCLPWHWPRALGSLCSALVVAALVFLVPAGFLEQAKGVQERRTQELVKSTHVEVQKQLADLKKQVRKNSALADLPPDLEQLDALPTDRMRKPGDVRQAALKKIDRLADTVRDKQGNERFERLGEMKRMLRALREPEGQQSPVSRLSRQLAAGEFKSAKQTMTEIKEQLATLKQDKDEAMVKQLTKQLDQLSKQLDQLASREQLRKKLEQAGIKKEDVERMLQQLTKKDLDQLRKQLQKNGLSQEKIEKLAQQMQKQQGAAQMMNKLAQAMKQGGQAAGRGDGEGSMDGLQQAGEQLDEMEALEQELNQLESMASALDDAKKNMGKPACSKCNGAGCGSCNGQGQGDGSGRGGMGRNPGQGRGGRAESEQTNVAFKIERGKVETTRGKIIGQFLVDGQQVKGEATDDFIELIAAAEREATDSVSRDRIPRQYHKAVKDYFDRLPAELGLDPARLGGAAPADSDSPDNTSPTPGAAADGDGQ